MNQFLKEIKATQNDLDYKELLQLLEQYQQTKSQSIWDNIFNSYIVRD